MLVNSEQRRWKVLETGGGDTNDDVYVSMHTLGGVWGHAPPDKLGALRSLLWPYLYSCHMSDVGISVDWI